MTPTPHEAARRQTRLPRCRRCGAPFDDDMSEGPCDYCSPCRYEFVHQYDEEHGEYPE